MVKNSSNWRRSEHFIQNPLTHLAYRSVTIYSLSHWARRSVTKTLLILRTFFVRLRWTQP